MEQSFYIHPVPSQGLFQLAVVCSEPFLLVAADRIPQQTYESGQQVLPVPNWQSLVPLDNSAPDPNAPGLGRGVVCGGFDGLMYPPPLHPSGNRVCATVRHPSDVLYVLTRSAQPPACVVSVFEF